MSAAVCLQNVHKVYNGVSVMALHGRMHHIPAAQRRTTIDTWLEHVELGDRRDDKVKNLSGGMKRRRQIARALLHNRKILFLDEPTVGLDP